MDLEIVIPSEGSQTEEDGYHMIRLYVESKKNDTNLLTYKTETDSQTYRANLRLLGEGWGPGILREFGIDMYILIYLKWITRDSFKMVEEKDVEITFLPKNTSKIHLHVEQLLQNTY